MMSQWHHTIEKSHMTFEILSIRWIISVFLLKCDVQTTNTNIPINHNLLSLVKPFFSSFFILIRLLHFHMLTRWYEITFDYRWKYRPYLVVFSMDLMLQLWMVLVLVLVVLMIPHLQLLDRTTSIYFAYLAKRADWSHPTVWKCKQHKIIKDAFLINGNDSFTLKLKSTNLREK